MIIFKNAKDIRGQNKNLTIHSSKDEEIDATGLTILPALIDPHVHFRTPGAEHKENWISGARASIAGGITTVFDMPNNIPACVTQDNLNHKRLLIEKQLIEADIPLRYHIYFGADRNHLTEIEKVKNDVVGLKIFMGSSTGNLLIDDESTLEKTFRIAADNDIIIAVHAEDEETIRRNKLMHGDIVDPAYHSKIRSIEAAEKSVALALSLAERTKAKLYIAHISTKAEVDLIRAAKNKGVKVFAETTPHHLFLDENDYTLWKMKVKMNPPLRSKENQNALWEAIHEGVIDTIGTDHAPHTLSEKENPYDKAPAGVPGVETLLPLLLNAYNEGRISLKQIMNLTRNNILEIFGVPSNEDYVLVDMNKERIVADDLLKTKCGWSPFAGRNLKGWPVYTILKERIFHVV